MSRPENQSGEQKILNALVARLVNKVTLIATNITVFRLTYINSFLAILEFSLLSWNQTLWSNRPSNHCFNYPAQDYPSLFSRW